MESAVTTRGIDSGIQKFVCISVSERAVPGPGTVHDKPASCGKTIPIYAPLLQLAVAVREGILCYEYLTTEHIA